MPEGLDSALGGIVEFSVEAATGTVPEQLLNGRGFEQIARGFDLQRVYYVADLLRDGAFASVGYRRSAVNAISDMWNINEAAAKTYVWAAENVCPRVSLEGQVLPPLLPAAAAAFAAGAISLEHVAEIVRALASNEASLYFYVNAAANETGTDPPREPRDQRLTLSGQTPQTRPIARP